MKDKTDLPLICDPVPGPSAGYFVVQRSLTAAEVERLRRIWRAAGTNHGRILIADPEWRPAPEPRQWPDAEFCAA